ncbi:hypothetical protein I4U23_014762 [Adineta vaga]|nr:hypothetical protein I4U23_014762 [Adineta vaga]
MDDQDWYEKDLDEFDDFQNSDDNLIVKRTIPPSKRKQLIIKQDDYNGTTYPLDFWYLIASHIAPEDVGRFALICRATNQVVNSVPFWIFLFRRYNQSEAKRRSRLLVREHPSIVRTYIIKSFYQTYPLFQDRLNKADAIQKDPHFLVSSRCIRIWYSKLSTQRELYNYYFEFCSNQDQSSIEKKIPIQTLSPLFQMDNLDMIDRNSFILHLVSSKLTPIGPFMGMILSKITLNVSSDYRYHKLKMWFDGSKFSSQKSNFNNSVVVIDPILCLRIYKWFNCPANLD